MATLVRALRRSRLPEACGGVHQLRSISIAAGNKVITSSGTELHPVWLRERCSSPASVQWETVQPLHQPHEIADGLEIVEAKLRNAGGGRASQLQVLFSDGHNSIFDGDALEAEAEDFSSCGIQQEDIRFPKPRLWDNITGAVVPRVQYATIAAGKAEDMLHMTTTLLREGQVVVEGVPCNDRELVKFAHLVNGFKGGAVVRPTNWGDVFNVRSVPDGANKDLAYTNAALCPHVDNPYRNPNPGFQLLHVLENECSTGLSLAVDGFAVAARLKEENPEYYDILTNVDCRWENDGGDRSTALVHFAPYISINQATGEVLQVRYSPKSGGYAPALKNSAQMETFYAARRRLAELLNCPSHRVNFRLNAGDLWLFNNLRVLHGRSEFDPTEGRRFFQGGYIDMDGVTSAYFRAKYAVASLRQSAYASPAKEDLLQRTLSTTNDATADHPPAECQWSVGGDAAKLSWLHGTVADVSKLQDVTSARPPAA
mmetsp:Transcript_2302/g.4799  ORF Transcript_2302/g.4799 Transcript_2302/m.4799 type:complete len:485 (+) Transcript_2302:70-1524(+)